MRIALTLLICFVVSAALAGCKPVDERPPAASAGTLARSLQVYQEGLDLTKKQKYDEAIAKFTEAIKLDERFVEAYIARGDAYTEKKEHGKGLADFNQALRLKPSLQNDPGSVWLYRDMTICNIELKNYPQAVETSTKMLSFNPRFEFGYVARAVAYEKLGQMELAKKDADTYESLKNPLGSIRKKTVPEQSRR